MCLFCQRRLVLTPAVFWFPLAGLQQWQCSSKCNRKTASSVFSSCQLWQISPVPVERGNCSSSRHDPSRKISPSRPPTQEDLYLAIPPQKDLNLSLPSQKDLVFSLLPKQKDVAFSSTTQKDFAFSSPIQKDLAFIFMFQPDRLIPSFLLLTLTFCPAPQLRVFCIETLKYYTVTLLQLCPGTLYIVIND
jgi:hypothetical protein